jgi:hypothetical protein
MATELDIKGLLSRLEKAGGLRTVAPNFKLLCNRDEHFFGPSKKKKATQTTLDGDCISNPLTTLSDHCHRATWPSFWYMAFLLPHPKKSLLTKRLLLTFLFPLPTPVLCSITSVTATNPPRKPRRTKTRRQPHRGYCSIKGTREETGAGSQGRGKGKSACFETRD